MSSNSANIEHYTTADGRRLSAHVWTPPLPAIRRAVFLHGISSHAGWYERGSARLAEAGIEVHFLNRRGSGDDVQDRGDVDCWQTWIDDVITYVRRIREARAGAVMLCGISWGGKLAAAVASKHASLIDGLALICPGLYSPFEPGPVKRLVLGLPAPKMVERRRLTIPLREPALFTETPSWQAFIRDDPFTLRRITWRFAREDRELTRHARRAAPLLKMPTLLMLAGRDRIIDNRRVRDFYREIPIAEKRLIEYPNAAHTLEFESDPQQYFTDLATWLRDTISGFGAR